MNRDTIVDRFIQDKAQERKINSLGYLQQIQGYKLTSQDLKRNIKKYDQRLFHQISQKYSTQQSESTSQAKFSQQKKVLQQAYRNFLKSDAFTIDVYRNFQEMSEDLRHILQTQSRKICRYKMFLSDFSPYDYYFISRTHTEPMILGGFCFAIIQNQSLYIKVLCSHKGQGSRLLQFIKGYAPFLNVSQIELFCLPDLQPFYEKEGFVYSKKDKKMIYPIEPWRSTSHRL